MENSENSPNFIISKIVGFSLVTNLWNDYISEIVQFSKFSRFDNLQNYRNFKEFQFEKIIIYFKCSNNLNKLKKKIENKKSNNSSFVILIFEISIFRNIGRFKFRPLPLNLSNSAKLCRKPRLLLPFYFLQTFDMTREDKEKSANLKWQTISNGQAAVF